MDINTAILCITTLVAMAGVVRIVVAIGGKVSLGGQTGTLHANVWLKSPSAKPLGAAAWIIWLSKGLEFKG